MMEMVVLVSVTSYSLSQNCPSDNNALLRMDGKMCALRTAKGKLGKSSRAVWDAAIIAPSGCFTWIPFVHGIMFVQGESVEM